MLTHPAAPAIHPVPGAHHHAKDGSPLAVATPDHMGLVFGLFLFLVFFEWVGVASLLPFLRTLRFSTALAYFVVAAVVLKVGASAVISSTLGRLHLAFIGLTIASVVWAVVRTTAFQEIRPHVDYFGLLIVAAMLINSSARIRAWCATCSVIALVLVARNINHLTSSTRQGVFAGGYFVGDGNDFAWGLCVLAPFTLFLAVSRGKLPIRVFGLVAFAACLFGVVGTQSRGAVLAMACVIAYYVFIISKHKALAIAVLSLAAVGGLAMVPSSFVERMQTLENVSEDNSAQGRLRAWRAAAEMSLDFPLGVGAGNFNSAYGRYYVDPNAEGWGAQRWISPHSVYFRVLGEYGLIGVIILLATIGNNYLENRRSYLALKSAESPLLPPQWPQFVTASLTGYCVAAIFLGGIAYPHLYVLSGLALSCRRARTVVPAASVSKAAATQGKQIFIHPALSPRALSAGSLPQERRR